MSRAKKKKNFLVDCKPNVSIPHTYTRTYYYIGVISKGSSSSTTTFKIPLFILDSSKNPLMTSVLQLGMARL